MSDAASDTVTAIAHSGVILLLARLLLTWGFWADALFQFPGFSPHSKALERFGLRPGWAFNVATIIL